MPVRTMPARHAAAILKGDAPRPASKAPAPIVAAVAVSYESQQSKAVDGLNKTERRFYEILRGRERRGELCGVRVQAFTLRLANAVRYTPDFSAVVGGRMKFFEVKGGFVREDAWVKLKIAAAQYPEFDFVMAQEIKRQWSETEVPK